MATDDQPAANRVSGWEQVRKYPPPRLRLRFGGFMLALASSLVAWSLLLALLGIGALDFTFSGLAVASHPEPFVLNGVALPLPGAVLVVAPLATLGIVGGRRTWLGRSPRLALLSSVAWIVTGAALVVAGGTPGMLELAAVGLAAILSGAWDCRRPGSNFVDLFLRGE